MEEGGGGDDGLGDGPSAGGKSTAMLVGVGSGVVIGGGRKGRWESVMVVWWVSPKSLVALMLLRYLSNGG